ncbi:MAG: DNA-directed RNA polymerase subunit alpha [SAR202 cluster bacterium]|nr:DNA-directed RNA polymerase subunit alpha [SAR202 cluster bacterium]MQG68268.1 DNA-directed RNA polymerase subunit alpha [SAR202 cluster bacterium]
MIEEEEEPIPSPQIEVETADDRYGKFVIEPLEPGYGVTLGNPLRRVLYSGLEGTAITWVKIEGIQHEFATVPHVKEQVTEMLLNVKGIRLRSEVDRPGKLRLEVAGEGEVCAGDIMASADFEVVNPELHLATLDSSEAKLSIELNVERGKGYQVAAEGDGQAIGVLPVDAIFTPINKVSYTIERTRVGQRTDFERLVLQVWTDGSKLPVEAVRQAANILVTQFYMFANAKIDSQEGVDGLPQKYIVSAEIYNVTVERLDLPSRTLNCLKRAGIDKVGQVLEMSRAELMRIRNFGDKSYKELFGKLKEMDYLPADMEPETADDEETEAVAAE